MDKTVHAVPLFLTTIPQKKGADSYGYYGRIHRTGVDGSAEACALRRRRKGRQRGL